MSLFALFAAALFACRYVSFTTRQHTFYKLLTKNLKLTTNHLRIFVYTNAQMQSFFLTDRAAFANFFAVFYVIDNS